jgi:hypothetical protein
VQYVTPVAGDTVTALALAKVARAWDLLKPFAACCCTWLRCCTALHCFFPTGDPTGTGKGGKSIYATPNDMLLLHRAHTLHFAALHVLCICR